MHRRAHILLVSCAALMWAAACLASLVHDRPLVEPEGKLLGPSFTALLEAFGAMPTNLVLVSIVVLIDVIVRAFTIFVVALALDTGAVGLWRSRRNLRGFWSAAKARRLEHWTKERRTLVVVGTVCFYLTYVSYRNLKSSLPFVRADDSSGEDRPLLYDRELHVLDRVIFFGNDPSDVLHSVFGTTWVAHVLSAVYLSYLPLVVGLVAVWVVWSRNPRFGYWFVGAQVLGWSLGTLTYYLLPTLGPGIAYWPEYTVLTHTGVTDLMDGLVAGRGPLLHDPTVEGTLNSVAGFASLHVAISMLWALLIHYTVRSTALRIGGWVYFALTVLATLYFGWHYVADDIAGVAVAVVAFYVAGLASGHDFARGLKGPPPEAELGSGAEPGAESTLTR